MMTEKDDRLAATGLLADRLVDAYVTRAGSGDAERMIEGFVESHESVQAALDGLAGLVLMTAERAAQASTVVDIWDPLRRVDPAKAMRLVEASKAAFMDLGIELLKGGKNG